MKTVCDMPSESVTVSVVRPEAYRHRNVWIAIYMASTLRGRRGEWQSDADIMGCAVGLRSRPAKVGSEVNTHAKRGQHTFEQNLEPKWLRKM